jgi:drug/metabolite transporter (DMT)-like permease
MSRQGILFVLLSAAGFGAMGILAKLAYATGLDVVTLLALRFALAAALLWALVRWRGVPLRRRATVLGLALGAGAYAVEAGLFFFSLERLDAGLASLLLYAYPAFVTLGAFLLGRERPTGRRWLALGGASLGVILVLGGGGTGADGIGVLLALGAGLGYAAYILGSDSVMRDSDPLAFAASVCTGACASFMFVGALRGGLDLGFAAEGWLWLIAITIASTVVPIASFAAGLARVGPSKASILSTVEPPFTVGLAFLVFGESLGAAQLLGGALVLAGALLVVDRAATAQAVSSASGCPSPSAIPSSPSWPSPPSPSPPGRPASGATSPSGTGFAASPSSTATTSTSSRATASRSPVTSPS